MTKVVISFSEVVVDVEADLGLVVEVPDVIEDFTKFTSSLKAFTKSLRISKILVL